MLPSVFHEEVLTLILKVDECARPLFSSAPEPFCH